jgi:hypothetical protein
MGAVALLLGYGLVGCKAAKGSCDRRADDHTCEEITASTIVDSSKYQCPDNPITHVNGTWSAGACDRTNAIAACENSLSRTWYYPGGNIQKPEHVAKYCSDISGTLLDAKGKKLTGVTPEEPGPRTDRKLAELVKSIGAPLESRVAAMEKISMPAGASGHVHPSGGKHITSHAAIVDDGDLLKVTELEGYDVPFPMPDGPQLRACGAAVRKNTMVENDPKKQKEAFSWCASLEYLVVVRASHLEVPKSYSGLNFVAGTVRGDVLIYELPSGKNIGGYAFHAESSKKVMSDELDSDFRTNYGKALAEGLAKADHGSTLAFAVGGIKP